MVFISQRIKILKYVAEQGVVCLDDVARHLGKTDQLPVIRTALYDCGIAHTKYRNLKQGIWYIENPALFNEIRNFYFPYLPTFQVGKLRLYLVEHSLELNRIRLTLEQTNQIIINEWWSENYIRALPSLLGSRKIAKDKIPDAIFWRQRTDATKQIFFLEYERSPKNTERYRNIFRFYSKLEGVKNRNVIYLCQDASLKEKLEELETRFAKTGELDGAGLYFQFITLEDFYKIYSANNHKEGGSNEQVKKNNHIANIPMSSTDSRHTVSA